VAKNPEDKILKLLREIRAKQDDQGIILERLDRDFQCRAEHPKYDERPDRQSEEAD
jgi:hypothetical protein